MSSFKNGISESEIEDILSLDDDVLYDIFEFHAPPIRKLPIALWSRIKHDLKGYMVEKEIDDTRVIYWYHRRFIEVANSFYISKLTDTVRESIFGNVVDFFNETWKNKPKPYKYNQYVAKKKNLKSQNAEEIRETSIQQTVMVDSDGNIKYNKRKLSELPAFISQLTANLAILLACEHVYFNYHFMTGMFLHCNFSEIIETILKITDSSSYKIENEGTKALQELNIFLFILLQSGLKMKEFPHSAVSILISKSLVFYGRLKYFTKIIDEYDRESFQNCSLVVPYQYENLPLNDVIFQLEKHTKPITHAIICFEMKPFTYTFTLSNKIHALNVLGMKELGEIQLKSNTAKYLYLIGFIKSFVEKEIDLLKNLDGGFILASKNELELILAVGYGHLSKKFTDDEIISDVYLISPNHLIVAFENQSYLKVFNFYSFEIIIVQSFGQKIKKVLVNTHKQRLNNLTQTLKSSLFLVALLDSNEIEIFLINNKSVIIEDKTSDLIKLEKLKTFPNSGFNITSMKFSYESLFKITFLNICLSDASLIRLSFDDLVLTARIAKSEYSHDLFKHIKPKFDLAKKNITFKLTDSNFNYTLLLGSDKHLYISYNDFHENFFVELKGNFDNGIFLNTKCNRIAAMCGGFITIYCLIGYSNINGRTKSFNCLNLVKLTEIDAHSSDITFAFNRGFCYS